MTFRDFERQIRKKQPKQSKKAQTPLQKKDGKAVAETPASNPVENKKEKKQAVKTVQTATKAVSNTKAKRRPAIKSKPVGFLCINKLMNKVIGKVLTKAKQRDKMNAKRRADPEKYAEINKIAQAKHYKKHKQRVLDGNKRQREIKHDAFLERTRKQRQKRRTVDKDFVIKDRLRARLSSALKRQRIGKTANTFDLIGCNIYKLLGGIHIRKGDDIDHIFPFKLFNLSNRTDTSKVMHFTNLQVLTHKENQWKSDKLPTKAMAAKVNPDCWPDGITMDMLPDIYPGWATPLRMHLEEEDGQEEEEEEEEDDNESENEDDSDDESDME
jgi:hypothetical protein